jgi:hypothetical protein
MSAPPRPAKRTMRITRVDNITGRVSIDYVTRVDADAAEADAAFCATFGAGAAPRAAQVDVRQRTFVPFTNKIERSERVVSVPTEVGARVKTATSEAVNSACARAVDTAVDSETDRIRSRVVLPLERARVYTPSEIASRGTLLDAAGDSFSQFRAATLLMFNCANKGSTPLVSLVMRRMSENLFDFWCSNGSAIDTDVSLIGDPMFNSPVFQAFAAGMRELKLIQLYNSIADPRFFKTPFGERLRDADKAAKVRYAEIRGRARVVVAGCRPKKPDPIWKYITEVAHRIMAVALPVIYTCLFMHGYACPLPDVSTGEGGASIDDIAVGCSVGEVLAVKQSTTLRARLENVLHVSDTIVDVNGISGDDIGAASAGAASGMARRVCNSAVFRCGYIIRLLTASMTPLIFPAEQAVGVARRIAGLTHFEQQVLGTLISVIIDGELVFTSEFHEFPVVAEARVPIAFLGKRAHNILTQMVVMPDETLITRVDRPMAIPFVIAVNALDPIAVMVESCKFITNISGADTRTMMTFFLACKAAPRLPIVKVASLSLLTQAVNSDESDDPHQPHPCDFAAVSRLRDDALAPNPLVANARLVRRIYADMQLQMPGVADLRVPRVSPGGADGIMQAMADVSISVGSLIDTAVMQPIEMNTALHAPVWMSRLVMTAIRATTVWLARAVTLDTATFAEPRFATATAVRATVCTRPCPDDILCWLMPTLGTTFSECADNERATIGMCVLLHCAAWSFINTFFDCEAGIKTSNTGVHRVTCTERIVHFVVSTVQNPIRVASRAFARDFTRSTVASSTAVTVMSLVDIVNECMCRFAMVSGGFMDMEVSVMSATESVDDGDDAEVAVAAMDAAHTLARAMCNRLIYSTHFLRDVFGARVDAAMKCVRPDFIQFPVPPDPVSDTVLRAELCTATQRIVDNVRTSMVECQAAADSFGIGGR